MICAHSFLHPDRRFFRLTLNLLFFPIVLFFSSPFCGRAQEGKGIHFDRSSSWSEILQRAKAEQKYIFIDAWATWCAPCKMMDERVYPDSAVGAAMNTQFINVKVQFDQTANDDAYTKSWYGDAKALNEKYKVSALPNFLFFTPDGELVHRGMGFQDPHQFISLAKFASDPKRKEYYALMKNYEAGKKDYTVLPGLITTTREIVGDKDKALAMAKDYKQNYLDTLPAATAITKDNLEFVGQYASLVHTNDQFFKAAYNEPALPDQLMDRDGWSAWLVTRTIRQDEIEKKLVKDGRPVAKHPNWKSIQSTIAKKYPKFDARKIMLDFQVTYYEAVDKNWKLWANALDQKIKLYPPAQGMQSFMELNMNAWNTFLHCDDKSVLQKALAWSELSINGYEHKDVLQQLDTRANLLYKLGRKEEAVGQEKLALETSEKMKGKPFYEEFEETLQKMQAGEPTWPTK